MPQCSAKLRTSESTFYCIRDEHPGDEKWHHFMLHEDDIEWFENRLRHAPA